MSQAPSPRVVRASLLTLCTLLAAAAVGQAEYAAWTVKASNLRAGPDSSYPVVTRIPPGAAVSVAGCVDGYSWCDVVAGPDRGWVHARNLEYDSEGSRVVVYGHPWIGLPVVTYAVGPYWDAYYVGRPWYGRRAYWVAHPVVPVFHPHAAVARSMVAHPAVHTAHGHEERVEHRTAPENHAAEHGRTTEHAHASEHGHASEHATKAPAQHAAPHAKASGGKHGHS